MHVPEKRHGVEWLPPAEHVARRGLPLALGNNPVLDADLLAAVRVRPAREITGGENAGDAGFEILVDGDAAVDREPGMLGKPDRRLDADTDDHEIRCQRLTGFQDNGLLADRGGRRAEVEL